MATETDYLHPHQACGSNWSCPDTSSDHEDSRAVPISKILDHGSISFGSYAAETLAWEKFSVFTHNRCQEELEKFKAPGLVAQKKAYFEEYYKKIRAIKGLQADAEQQEAIEIDPFQDGEDSINKGENCVDDDASREESTSRNAGIKQFSDKDATANLSSSPECVVYDKEQQIYFNGSMDKVNTKDETGVPLSATIAELSERGDPSSYTQSIKTSSKAVQKESLACSKVKHSASQLKNQAPAIRPKGSAACAANKEKLDCRIKKDTVKPSEKPKPSLCWKTESKENDNLSSGKRITPKAASNIKSQSCMHFSEGYRSATVPHSSLIKDKMVSRSSNIRHGPLKENHKGLAGKIPVAEPIPARSSETMNETYAGLGRYPKRASAKVTDIHKFSNGKCGQKISLSRSADLMHDQRVLRSDTKPSCRQKMPIWR